jgi:hypothetical protein
VLAAHLGSRQVSRLIYGMVVGLALVVALDTHPPSPGSMAGLLASTGVSVALAELYSDLLGARIEAHGALDRGRRTGIAENALAVAVGAGFPAVFFVLAAVGVMESSTAFELAKWTGLVLIGCYGYCAEWLAGSSVLRSLLGGAAVSAIGVVIVIIKSLVH